MNKIKNIDRVADRIRLAKKENEEIVLYGDADLDGTASVVILKESIEAIGGNVSQVYFPDRGKEGYGINDKALKIIKERAGKKQILLIVMDCGIANFKEAKTAKELGMDLVIIDHHQPHKNLPEASIIIDPKQESDQYPFKDFANAGIIFRLAEELIGEKFFEFRRGFSELAALATISDMMRQEGENKEIITEGLDNLEETKRPGLKAFWTNELFEDGVSIRDIAQRIISVLNASEIINHKTEAYLVLTSNNKEEIRLLLGKMVEKNNWKQTMIAEMVNEVSNNLAPDATIIFYGKEGWEIPLLGSAGSKLENILKIPVFLYSKGEKISRGAVRMPQGINAVDVMNQSFDILTEYGGHPPAAGFEIVNEKIGEFEKRLREYFKK